METWSIRTMAPEETMVFAKKLGDLVQQGDVITLEGDLGAGKTSFTKGLARGLGVKRVVNSPTFTIMKQYRGRVPLYHMDAYRLENEYEDLGFEEYFYGDGVTVIEWPSMIIAQLPQDRLKITIEYKDENERLITIEATGSRSSELSKELAV
ncbi:tRNA (adenosine(37)-N6)-threonylcarbamoyltransferase complex ATPase subunit type 1 TsaE [Halalkalibacter sp. APA_J-10(15)]|uniref:tRNA (adenosine(37)-N6)-threonylcarbamoyltransferase complex ATPase subunit type 1 TsaE n=1 Tax=unclassified Halalkalibacter TaxID=2893063 RepID=UPI001FF29E92|nr:tRNA (adenosine(37)-N6)-threonylcarbamoyltransferase complex ATPase subunit type 1 TsaE [Halalkalibacter sp. APA_J-10(15)]MCK0473426.1 tRNA (adenosine(37)-N6)-threonylcarbamoyltransferase complex ATPase subunit type 1 TsaE [Halalkalibacter sp. APA_J-10(15)]